MKKLLVILLPLILSSCDHFGSTKVKSLIDLTPKLEVEKNTQLSFEPTTADIFANQEKTKSYNLAKRDIIAEPAIAKGIIYSVDKEGYVSAFSLQEKKILWRVNIAIGELDRNFNSGGILFSDNRLYVTYGSRNLVILDSSNGNEVIRKEFPDILRSKPVMGSSNILIAQTISNQLIAYDIQKSAFIWMHEGGIETISSKTNVYPVVYDGYVIASYSSGEIVCLNAQNGAEKWTYSLDNISKVGAPNFEPFVVTTTPIIFDNNIYFATSNSKLIKLNVHDGDVVWIRDASDIQSMTLHGSSLFITNNARQAAAISIKDGSVNWVGNLISAKERSSKKPQAVYFQKPFISKINDQFSLNVIASNGQMYQFVTDASGTVPSEPHIIAVDKNIRYIWLSCCSGNLHLITNYKITF